MNKIFPYSCPVCSRNFRTKAEFIKHLRVNGSEYFIPKAEQYKTPLIKEQSMRENNQ